MDVDDGGDTSSTISNAHSNEELLQRMNSERQSLLARKAALGRELALATSNEVMAAHEASLGFAEQEIALLEKRMHYLLGAIRDAAAIYDPLVPEISSRHGTDTLSATLDDAEVSLKITRDMPRFNKNDNPREFLDQVQHIVSAYVGQATFEKECTRYVLYLTTSDYHRNRFKEELARRAVSKLAWDECESVFLGISLTEQERIEQIKALLETGREAKESYREFAMRVSRDIRVYGVKDDNEMVLTLLGATVPCDILNFMQLRLFVEKGINKFVSVNDFTNILSTMVGPNKTTPKTGGIPKTSSGSSRQDNRRNGSSRRPYDRVSNGRETNEGRSSAGNKKYHCKYCGQNETHDTKDHVECTRCHRAGHKAATCRHPAASSNNGNHRYGKHNNAIIKDPSHVKSRLTDSSTTPLLSALQATPSQTMTKVASNSVDMTTSSCKKNKVHGSHHDTYVLDTPIVNAVLVQNNTSEKKKRPRSHSVNVEDATDNLTEPAKLRPHSNGQRLAARTLSLSNASELYSQGKHIDLDELFRREQCLAGTKDTMPNQPSLSVVRISSLCRDGDERSPFLSKLRAAIEVPDKRIIVQINFEGELYDALLDTGATDTCIRKDIALRHHVPVLSVEGVITLADESITIPRIGRTDNIELTYGDRVVSASLEVLEQSYPFILGMDLFHELGLGISGLVNPGDDAKRLPEPEQDRKPSLIPRPQPVEELTAEFVDEKKRFLDSIRMALQGNAAIPPTSHCPVPEMKVYLPVPEGTILFRRPRPFAQKQLEIFDETIDKWLRDDVITLAPVGNVHNNTLTLAAKKDSEGRKTLWRVCLDPRPLNKHLPDDNFPLPLINDIIARLAGNAVFSTIDLSQAYHRLPVHVDDQPLTAFMHGGRQYMFKKAPFGLKPLSSLFQRGMSRILGDLAFVCNFIDDIVVFSKNKEEHAEHVRTVIQRLNEAKLIINKDKCNFFSTQICLLGFTVSLHGKSVDPTKFANIDEWDAPVSGKQVSAYLGTFNFVRGHIPLYSDVAAPLESLRHRTDFFELDERQLESFTSLKNIVAYNLEESFPDYTLPFHVGTDASGAGISGVLYQLPNGPDHPEDIKYISFMARSLSESERKYSATKRELLAIVFALNKFHYYIWGRHFDLYTDHRALTFIHTQRDLNPMMTAWQDTLLNYSFTVHYRPGILNVLPDALSRLFPTHMRLPKTIEHEEHQVALAYVHAMQNDETARQIVPEKERDEILHHAHAMGHLGTNAMVKSIQSQGKTWPHLAQTCSEYVKRCRECQRFNIARKGYHPMKAIHAHLPGEHMAIDLAGPFVESDDKNVYLLVVVDVCTRFVLLDAIPDKTAYTVAKTLFKRFTDIGFPRVLQSDNGREFVNEVVRIMTTQMYIDHRLVTPYHPRGNGVAENHVKTVCNMIRKEVKGDHHHWDRHVPFVQMSANTRTVSLHNSSPFSLFFARKANGFSNYTNDEDKVMTHEQLLERLKYMTEIVFPAVRLRSQAQQKKMIDRFNASVLHNDFPDGAKVMSLDPIKGNKLTPRYEGPFTVVQRSSHGSYILKDGTGAVLTRHFAPSQLKLVLDDFEDTKTYEVEKVLDHRLGPDGPNDYEYFVKWKGFSHDHNSWEPVDHFFERLCISEYWAEFNKRRALAPAATAISSPPEVINSKPIQTRKNPKRARRRH